MRRSGRVKTATIVIAGAVAFLVGFLVLVLTPCNTVCPPREPSLTQERIGRLVLAVEQLRAWQLLGRYPPSRLDEVAALRLPSRLPDAGAPNRLNEGAECLVLVARLLDFEIGIYASGLANADLD